MSRTVDDLAQALATDTIKAMDATGHERLYVEIGAQLAASSQTLEEAYLTEVRVRLAERAARAFLIRRVKEIKSGQAPSNPA